MRHSQNLDEIAKLSCGRNSLVALANYIRSVFRFLVQVRQTGAPHIPLKHASEDDLPFLDCEMSVIDSRFGFNYGDQRK